MHPICVTIGIVDISTQCQLIFGRLTFFSTIDTMILIFDCSISVNINLGNELFLIISRRIPSSSASGVNSVIVLIVKVIR